MDSIDNSSSTGRVQVQSGNMASLTDAQLLERFVAAQEQAAFEELVRRHGPMVLRVCQRVLHHGQDAEDAFQATFIVLMRKAGTVAKQEVVGSWLYGVAYRAALEAKTLASRRDAREKLSRETELEDDRQARAATELTSQDLRRVLDQELQRLPEKYRAAVVLCYFEGKTPEEAAQLLHCQTGALKMRLSRAREMLRNRLTRRGVTLSAGGFATLLAQEAASAAVLPPALVGTSEAALLAATGQGVVAAKFPCQALAAAVLRDMGRRKGLRWAAVLAVALLGAAGVALGVWSRPNSLEHAEEYEQ